ncbi:poly(ADP-ribose) glycohydrolase [Chelonus insularis]|uniref:poly(ADP-ribose) glycohydrolase n=1 Tax=Chelonus insularis TaxID=460826 RepID=UPI00158EB4B1|nr:poly(ADP-ribose) glycohydrolase [Chelonus insularis]XP_034945168.1 poly(ADP-ribose) glycohydrolase [Chelonus insularis]
MAESNTTLKVDYNEPTSPDIFCEFESPNHDEEVETNSIPLESEPDVVDDTPEWKGVSMDKIHKGLGPFGHQQHLPIRPSEHHTVLFQVPIPIKGYPKPYPNQNVDKWGKDFVRMPTSPQCFYPIEEENKPKKLLIRWEVIQQVLSRSIMSSLQLEAAIMSYNNKYISKWNFSALHNFFTNVMDEENINIFFDKLLPKIIRLALDLPSHVTGPIPLLKHHTNSSISFSQLQIASLLANAFFCTFPRRNSRNPESEYALYPYINFNGLFSAYRENKPNRSASVTEKLKCLFHYFRRVTSSTPEGTITIERRYIPKEDCPTWDTKNEQLPPLHITSKGTIETEGAGLLQVDFANKYIGGGVLYWGCVQEEIRFVICPELIATMLVTEVLDDTEALIITGVERYSTYEGYSNSFKWTGNFVDETPRDSSGRRKTSIVAIDALRFSKPDKQFEMINIIRELNKAYVGFSSSQMPKNDLSAVATGNWGCGAFRGNPKLKVLIQLMAAAVAGRSLVYFTFGDKNLRDSVADMYWHLINQNVDVGWLYTLLRAYESESTTNHLDFYRFLYKRSKIKRLTDYFPTLPKQQENTATLERRNNVLKRDNKHLSMPKYEPVVHRSHSEIQKTMLNHQEDQELIQKLFNNCTDISSDTVKEKKIKSTNVTVKKKTSLWEIFAEKESEQDRMAVRPSEKQSTDLQTFDTSMKILDCTQNSNTDDNKTDMISKSSDMESINSDQVNNEVEINLSAPTKLTDKLTKIDYDKDKANLSINYKKLPSQMLNRQKGGQKKINDYFTSSKFSSI